MFALPLSMLLAACGSSSSGTSTNGDGGASSSTGDSQASSGSGGSGGGETTSTGTGASTSSSSGTGGGGSSCTSARNEALAPIDTVSTGAVKTISTSGSTLTLYVDASAGGIDAEAQNPWIYLSLKTGTAVAVDDTASLSSTAWDLGIKRPILRTNGGDGGPGMGGAVLNDKAFDALTAADAASSTIAVEHWFDAQCDLQTDQTGAIATTFENWYDYDLDTNTLTPFPGTWIVKGGDGALYKLAILDYYANPDGTSGTTSGRYKLEVAPLQ